MHWHTLQQCPDIEEQTLYLGYNSLNSQQVAFFLKTCPLLLGVYHKWSIAITKKKQLFLFIA